MDSNTNPFNITKAVDYSNEEINDLWVDLPSGGFAEIVKPTSPMPMLILGGKGSGKTHIMKYYSYDLQKLRYKNNQNGIAATLLKDQYLGLYMRCGGLNSGRFTKKGLNEDQWKTLFSFYIEIWFSQLVLLAVDDVIQDSLVITDEEHIVNEILQLFDIKVKKSLKTIKSLLSYIRSIQKSIDLEINNLGFEKNKTAKLKIVISPGSLIFGLPRLIKQEIPFFKNFTFLYLIDEYENLEFYQQKYFNTLIREREFPTTFKIGARLYGMKTYKTFSGDEEIIEGSEYELVNIDSILRHSKDYQSYVESMCIKRLESHGYEIRNKSFNDFFQEFDIEYEFEKIKSKGIRKYFITLKSKLSQLNVKIDIIDQIINNLQFPKSLIIERTNLFLFYREYKNQLMGKSTRLMIDASEKIANEAIDYYADNTKTMHSTVLLKYKNDIIDQIFREHNIDLPYYGFNNLVKMSSGIPRVLLKGLKEIYKQSFFNAESPFNKGIISLESQHRGLMISSSWFIEDAIPPIERKVELVLKRLGTFLQEIRFSDNPPECSISIFSVNYSYLDADSKNMINSLKNYSLIIRAESRRDKNGNSISETYQINGIICPTWELAISKRGTINLSRNEIQSIFGDRIEMFKDIVNLRLRNYDFPFSNSQEALPLFKDDK